MMCLACLTASIVSSFTSKDCWKQGYTKLARYSFTIALMQSLNY